MNIRILCIGTILTLIVGCSMPATTVKSLDSRPSISITGAPQGAVLFVDGVSMGIANQYDGQPKILTIEPGTHKIEVRNNSDVIYQQTIFVESELKNIVIK
jgi:hypothetical protein